MVEEDFLDSSVEKFEKEGPQAAFDNLYEGLKSGVSDYVENYPETTLENLKKGHSALGVLGVSVPVTLYSVCTGDPFPGVYGLSMTGYGLFELGSEKYEIAGNTNVE